MSAIWCINYLCLTLQCDTPILEAIYVRFSNLWFTKDFLEIATQSKNNQITLKNLQQKYFLIGERSSFPTSWNFPTSWSSDQYLFRLSNRLQCQIVFSKLSRRVALYFVFELEQGSFKFTCCDLSWDTCCDLNWNLVTTLKASSRLYIMVLDGKSISRPIYLLLDLPNFNLKSTIELLVKAEDYALTKWQTLCIRPFNYTTTDPTFVAMIEEFHQIRQ